VSYDGTQLEPVTLTFAVPQARELTEVLPWLLHALEDRPGLSAKQRRRRQATQSAMNGLLAQLTERLGAYAAANPVENGT
jgi:hypothetical protein